MPGMISNNDHKAINIELMRLACAAAYHSQRLRRKSERKRTGDHEHYDRADINHRQSAAYSADYAVYQIGECERPPFSGVLLPRLRAVILCV